MIKRTVSRVLLFAVIMGAFALFASCSGFVGGIKTFYNCDSTAFYADVLGIISSTFGGYKAFDLESVKNGQSVMLDASLSLSDYKHFGETIYSGDGTFESTIVATRDANFALTTKLDALGQKAEMEYIAVNDGFYMNLGSFTKKPFYYIGENQEGIFQNIKAEIVNKFKDGAYVNGEEAYKVNGVTVDADTVEICLNSDTALELANKIVDLFIDTKNYIYGSYLNDVMNLSYMILEEKLHITWKRYLIDGKLCRESFKIHDNNSHYIMIDTAIAKKDKKHFLEIAVTGFDGNSVFSIFSLSATYKNTSPDFQTTADILIGDALHVKAKNVGSSTATKGTASVRFMTTAGEADLPVALSWSADSGKYLFSSDSNYVAFKAELGLDLKNTEDKPKLPEVTTEEAYDISVLENRYYYDEAKSMLDKEYSDIITVLNGKTPEKDPEPSKPEVEPFKLDIYYDYSLTFETNGDYGKKYVDLLNSDKFTYSYTYHENDEGYPLNKCTQYQLDDQTLYKYEYEDGTEYIQLFAGTTRYEVRHDLEKILYTEYSEEDFELYYPKQVYNFYESGLCNYNSRELVYERYFDLSNNKYVFIFDENKNLELIVIESSSDQSVLYTFIEEFSEIVPEDVMKLPNYEYENVLDHFQ